MARSDWLALVAVHADTWLIAVAFYNGARLNREGRERLFELVNELPTCYEVVSGKAADVGDGGAGCDRPCSGQEMRHELSLCCDTLWLPSLIFRNILEYPQGRMQAYKIRARDNGVVTWRVEVRCRLFLISDRRHLFNSFSFLF